MEENNMNENKKILSFGGGKKEESKIKPLFLFLILNILTFKNYIDTCHQLYTYKNTIHTKTSVSVSFITTFKKAFVSCDT